jgi:replicative DNA helicase
MAAKPATNRRTSKKNFVMFTKDIHYSPDLERAIIGACLLEREAFGRVYTLLDPSCFYNTGHREVYETIRNMYINGIPIDSFTLVDQFVRLQGKPQILKYDARAFILQTTNCVVSTTHLEYHAYVVKTMWMERELIMLTTGGTAPEGDTRTKIAEIQSRLHELQQKTVVHDWSDMTQLMVDLYTHQAEMKATGGMGLSCGIKELDRENGGFHPGQMVVIGARPSVGKSALAGSISLHAARQGKSVGIISLEMSNVEIAARLASLDTDTDFKVLYRGLYADEHQTHEVYRKIGNETSTLPIYVTDKTNVNIVEIRSKADKLKSLHGLDMLVIDYLQLIDVQETHNRNRENEIAKVSRYCKVMAKEMNIPVMLLCQLNRESTKRHGDQRYPQLSDLRESGSIEQDADVVMFLHRDFMSGLPNNEDGTSTEFQADLVIRKWRNGKNNFIIPMDFDPPKMRFSQRHTNDWKPINIEHHDNQ